MDIKTVIHLGRFKQIVLTLFKYGFNDLVERLELPGKDFIEKIHPTDPNLNRWERVRFALEELGPTFVKIGQVLSQRPDIVPPPLIIELSKLQEQVRPVTYFAIRKVVEKNLQRPLEEIFLQFNEVPRAAASLAQVHQAVLREGKQVVAVKVQRPAIRDLIDTDLHILEVIARRLHERMESIRVYDMPGLVHEIGRSLHRELDFTRELRNMKVFQSHFQGNDEIYVPKVYEAYCTDQVLTMEMVDGTKLNDFMQHPLEEREVLARRGVRLTIKQILEDGFFHADPHPGNVLILDNFVYCLLDFGMMGRLTEETRFDLIDMMNALVDKDGEKMLDSLLRLVGNRAGGPINERALQREILDILDIYHSVPLKDLNIGHLMLDIISMLRENALRVPTDLALMIKTLVTAEGTARQLYPDLNIVDEAEPYVRRLAKERWGPTVLWHSVRRSLYFFFELQKQLPQKMSHILDKVDRGELNIRFQHENLGGLLHTLEAVTTRLASAIIIAALVIASSLLIISNITGLLTIGIIGYIISAILGVWLVITTLFGHKF